MIRADGEDRNQVLEYKTAAIQNIEVLIRYAKVPSKVIMKVSVKGTTFNYLFLLIK
jgi:hypothetical protein